MRTPSNTTIRFGLRAPLWKREALTRRFLKHYDDMVEPLKEQGVDLILVAVGTGRGYISRVSRGIKHWQFINYPNNPKTLGRKMAAGLTRLRKEKVDAALNMGSDDFISIRTLLTLVSLMRSGVDFVGWSSGCYFADLRADRMLRWVGYPPENKGRHDEPIGAGRCYSARLLDALQWDLWIGGRLHALDAGSWRRLRKLRTRFDIRTMSSEVLGPLVDVKGPDSATSWRKLGAHHQVIPTREAHEILRSVGLPTRLPPLPTARRRAPVTRTVPTKVREPRDRSRKGPAPTRFPRAAAAPQAPHCFYRTFTPPAGLRVVEEYKVPGTPRKVLFVLEPVGGD